MKRNYELPGNVERAYSTVVNFVQNSCLMKHPSIFGLILKDNHIGESAIRTALRDLKDLNVIFLPSTMLRAHDVDAIKETVRSEVRRFGKDTDIVTNLGLWETLREASRSLGKDRMTIWLDFTEAPMKYWADWRTLIEKDISSLLLVCTQDQWDEARKEVPELTNCVMDKTELKAFLSREDLENLRSIISVYTRTEFSENLISEFSREIKRIGIERINELEFRRLIWRLVSEGTA